MSKRFYWKKIRPILLSIFICCVFFLLLMAFTSNRNGNLTIFVDRSSITKSLSLSESSTLSNPKGKIYGPSLDGAWDTSEDYIPSDVYLKDGNNSGKNYMAYTFYVFNSGIERLDYSMKFEMENTSKNLDDVIRVRFYVNDVLTTYAKKSTVTDEPETGTTAFESDSLITSHTITDFDPNEVTKYSIVVWVAGEDYECTNEKIGGSITLSMTFSVLGIV